MSGSLKELVRSIRCSKTASEERAILAKECAKIRSSLDNDSVASRRRNISKLLFIHLLGYPTNFGQVECIKLIASSKFSDKRIGYLALNMLLTEDSEVLMLATNSIKIDLNNPNPYVCEMALRSLANIGTNEMLSELQNEIERLLKSNVPNIKKKAAICTVRMLRKAAQRSLTPDAVSVELANLFSKHLEGLVADADSGVKAAGLALMAVLLEHYAELCDLEAFFNLLMKTLEETHGQGPSFMETTVVAGDVVSNLGAASDQAYDDAFAKVKLLSLVRQVYTRLRAQRRGSTDASGAPAPAHLDATLAACREQLYEAVEKIVNAPAGNANDAVLYECIATMECEFADPRFNELGKTVAKKFMSGNNNVKYIALGIIKKLHNVNMEYGDSNWRTIVQSFKQPDVSIRRKALEVALKVVNPQTLKPLVQYLYDFLLRADEDMKRDSMHRIFACVNAHSEDLGYKLKVFVRIFTIAGNSVPDLILFDFIELLAAAAEPEKADTTVELALALRFNMGQSALVKAALYALGEHYQLLPPESLRTICTSQRSAGTPAGSSPRAADKPAPAPDAAPQQQTSVDLLLDLSTPKNADSRAAANASGRPAAQEPRWQDREVDLLLDLSEQETPDQTPTPETRAVSGADELGAYGLDLAGVGPAGAPAGPDAPYDTGADLSAGLVELIEHVSARLIAKNLLTECEYLITCVGKLAHKVPGQTESLRKILRKFRRHPNPELQQRSCELDIMIQENLVELVDAGGHAPAAVAPAAPATGADTPVPDFLGLDLAKAPEREAPASAPAQPGPQDLFDEFFAAPAAETPAQAPWGAEPDRVTHNIVENVAIVSSREKREDDFQQFDPF